MVRKAGVRRKCKKNYSIQTMMEAMQKVVNGEMSLRMAARIYNIPHSTLNDKLTSTTPLDTRPGPKPLFSLLEEETIIQSMLGKSQDGRRYTLLDLKLAIKDFLDRNGRPNILKNNTPGRSFLMCFIERNRNILKEQGASDLIPATIPCEVKSRKSREERYSTSEKALALKVIESMMSPTTILTYKNIYLSGIYLPTDEFYNIWKLLREDSIQTTSDLPTSEEVETNQPEMASSKPAILMKLVKKKRKGKISKAKKTGVKKKKKRQSCDNLEEEFKNVCSDDIIEETLAYGYCEVD